MIYSSKAREGRRTPPAPLEQSHLKSNLIRIYPMPDGVGVFLSLYRTHNKNLVELTC